MNNNVEYVGAFICINAHSMWKNSLYGILVGNEYNIYRTNNGKLKALDFYHGDKWVMGSVDFDEYVDFDKYFIAKSKYRELKINSIFK